MNYDIPTPFEQIASGHVIYNMTGTILYDGICNLCLASVRFIQRHDTLKKFQYKALQSPEGKRLSGVSANQEADLHTIIYIEGEKRYIRSTAILHILRDMGGIWLLFYIFIIIPTFLRDPVYHLVSLTRYRLFGKHTGSPTNCEV